ncbi:16S rRNA (guanine(966)-N(2))-methyltransferase RsmD [Thiohalorhabdus methylotrophus]|uniref:Ribosomal RNA small subunit methyltransferase D n=1 Tax=Thiohalorhabdus methylotrophus TaxID=3242694 RepID=A0ABV4TVN6_9GAMM
MRVIGGAARGRRLRVPRGKDVRPTADRVRETLFNWLQGEVEGARVLDLFAGSGALGIEALSRGAGHATFVEQGRPALAALRDNLTIFGEDARIRVVPASAWRFLAGTAERPFDLVFLDPPFGHQWAGRAAAALEVGGWLAPEARIYLEAGKDEGSPTVPERWREDRSGTCGASDFHLYRRDGE